MAKAKAYYLSGRITDLENQPLAGLNVQLFTKASNVSELMLGQAMTYDQGQYSIAFYATESKTAGPDVLIRIFDGDKQLGESLVSENVAGEFRIDFHLDSTKDDPNEPTQRVSGWQRDSVGGALDRCLVQAFARHLRNEQPHWPKVFDNKTKRRSAHEGLQPVSGLIQSL